MIEPLAVLALAGLELLAGLAGAATTVVLMRRKLRRRSAVRVNLELGQVLVEGDDRSWRVVSRSFDVGVGQLPSLRLDLVLAEDSALGVRS